MSEAAFEKLVVQNIEEKGRHVMGVGGEDYRHQFLYTIGNNRLNLPELLIIGIPFNAGTHLLNFYSEHMIERKREFSNGELIDLGSRVKPMAVHVNQLEHVMKEFTCWANWYYGHRDYRVTQIIVPDLKGRFGKNADEPYCSMPIYGVMP